MWVNRFFCLIELIHNNYKWAMNVKTAIREIKCAILGVNGRQLLDRREMGRYNYQVRLRITVWRFIIKTGLFETIFELLSLIFPTGLSKTKGENIHGWNWIYTLKSKIPGLKNKCFWPLQGTF